ncbi:MAG: hypothetical protein GW778_06845 [Alphaproteobacteria bacterium]|nr:hypothetical protein [Alphaproteobacteria bacterium]
MILSDFLTLDTYFDNQASAQFFEECSHKYGVEPIRKCLRAGDLACRKILMGPDVGKTLLWITEKGRQKARESAMTNAV